MQMSHEIRRSIGSRINRRLTEILLKAIDGKDEILGRKLPKNLIRFRDHCLWYRDREPTKCPEELEIKVLNVAYCDLFFVEDFGHVKEGIERLNKEYGSKIFRVKEEEVETWFRNAEACSMGHAASHRFGYFHLQKKHSLCKLVGDIFFETKQFAPSVIALTIIVYPTEEFHNQFQRIIGTNSYPIVQSIYKFRYGLIESSIRPATVKKMLEVDHLFSEMNREIIKLLKKYIGVGLCQYGLLPSVELLTVNQPLSFFSQNREDIKDDSIMRRGFWTGMGLDVYSSLVYTGESFKLYRVDRTSSDKIETYQIIQSFPDFKFRINGEETESEISHHFEYLLPEICAIVAMKQFSHNLESEIVSLRNKITPYLSDQTRRGVNIINLRRAVSKLANISGLLFQQQRLISETNDKFVKHILTYDLKGITRQQNSEKDTAEFYDDMLRSIERKNNFLKSQLDILKTSFQDLVSYKSLRANYTIQILLFILTLITVILTIALLIPETKRNQLLRYFFDLLR